MAWVDKVGILGCRNSGELLVLIRVGNHVGGDMRGCFTLARTLARECLMGESTVLRHLRRLRAGGILLPGDQNLVDHIRADKRPSRLRPCRRSPARLPRETQLRRRLRDRHDGYPDWLPAAEPHGWPI
ncbi:helix-turn-helix domain-containing protein [Streptomyces sp. NPDC001719]